MRRIQIYSQIIFLLISTNCFAEQKYLFIKKTDRAISDSGVALKGDVIAAVPVTAQYEPTPSELNNYRIIKVDVEQSIIDNLKENKVVSTSFIDDIELAEEDVKDYKDWVALQPNNSILSEIELKGTVRIKAQYDNLEFEQTVVIENKRVQEYKDWLDSQPNNSIISEIVGVRSTTLEVKYDIIGFTETIELAANDVQNYKDMVSTKPNNSIISETNVGWRYIIQAQYDKLQVVAFRNKRVDIDTLSTDTQKATISRAELISKTSDRTISP